MGEADMDRARAEEAACVAPDDDVAVVWVGKDTDCRGEDTKLLVNPRVNEGSSRSAAAAAWVPDNLVMVNVVAAAVGNERRTSRKVELLCAQE